MYIRNLGAALLCSALLITAKSKGPADRIRVAASVFQEIQGAKDKGIPDKLLEKANGIIIVPGLKRAGFVVGANTVKECSSFGRPRDGQLRPLYGWKGGVSDCRSVRVKQISSF